MGLTNRNQFTPRDVLRVLFRHKKKVCTFFLLTVAITVSVVLFWPRNYRSEARLFIRVGRESATLDPTATTSQVMQLQLSRKTEINSVRDMLESRVMLEKVVDEIGPETILRQSTDSEAAPGLFAISLPELDPVSVREAAVNDLAGRVSVVALRDSNVILVAAEAKSPELAQRIVSTLVNVYLDEHVQLNRTPGSHEFFVHQAALLEDKLRMASEELRDVKNEVGLVSIESQRKVMQEQMSLVEVDYLRAESSLAASEGKIAVLRKTIDTLDERVMTDEVEGFPNQAADAMRSQLYALEIAEEELASKFTDKHPMLVAIRKQIAEARKIVDSQQPQRTQWTTTVNPIHQNLRTALLTEESNAGSLRAHVQTLKKLQDEVKTKLETLNNQEVRIVKLEREANLLDAAYTVCSEKLEQSRMEDAIQGERISNVNVAQAATFVEEPASPNKLLVMALGLFTALFGGIGLALGGEYLNHTFTTPAEAEEALNMPVMLTIPRVSQRHVVLN